MTNEGNGCAFLFDDFEAVVGFAFGNDGKVGDEDGVGGRGFAAVHLGKERGGTEFVRKGDGLFVFACGAFEGEFEFLARLADGRVHGGGAGGLGEL